MWYCVSRAKTIIGFKQGAKMTKYHIFWKFLAKKHYFENKWQSTTFSRTRVAETWVPYQFYHHGTAELEFVRLKKIMWYLSLVNSSTMQHSTQVYQAQVPFIKIKKINKKKKEKNNAKNTKTFKCNNCANAKNNLCKKTVNSFT